LRVENEKLELRIESGQWKMDNGGLRIESLLGKLRFENADLIARGSVISATQHTPEPTPAHSPLERG